MYADLVIYNIGSLLTPNIKAPIKGKDMNLISEFSNAFIAIKDGKILDFGQGDYIVYQGEETIMHNAFHNLVIPGLIDSHTHLVHAGSRENEFKMKLDGVPYLDILKQGGGILSTVKSTRESTFEDLYKKAEKTLNNMLLFGVTSVEAKSGYGLNLETELKQLEVAKRLNDNHYIDIVNTYMGAHTIPNNFANNREEYIESIISDMEIIKEKGLAKYIDVFCEDSVFTMEESKYILEHGKKIGLIPKIHSDEISSIGGTNLAVELEASSADHLMAITDEDILRLSSSKVIANILPSTSFYLNKEFAPARKMIDSNCALSISSDYNPGSSPCENYQFVMQLAANKLRMTPNEILNASTLNAAYNLGISDSYGSIEIGKNADLVIMDSKNLEYILYHFGINHTLDVFKNGKLVVQNKKII